MMRRTWWYALPMLLGACVAQTDAHVDSEELDQEEQALNAGLVELAPTAPAFKLPPKELLPWPWVDDRIMPLAPNARRTPWAVVLCKFSDDDSEPETRDYFQDLFGESGAGMGGEYDFFRQMSYGTIDLGGTYVTNWRTVNLKSTDKGATVPRWSGESTTLRTCLESAQNEIYFPNYFGVVAVYNKQIDSGALNQGPISITLNGQTKDYAATITSLTNYDVSFTSHEMLHGYGQDHSYGVGCPDHVYGDYQDIMSWWTSTSVPHPLFGNRGPGLNVPERAIRGWLPPRKEVVATLRGEYSYVVAAADRPDIAQPLLIDVPFGYEGRHYTIEYRRKRGFDGAIVDGVHIREVRQNRRVYRPNIGAVELGYGQTFYDQTGEISITAYPDPGAETATVTIRRAPPPGAAFRTERCDAPPAGFSPSTGTSAASWGAGRLDVFGLDQNNYLAHMWYADGWSEWEAFSPNDHFAYGQLSTEAAAVSWGPNRIDVFALDLNKHLVHTYFDGSSWQPHDASGKSTYEQIGNDFYASAPAVASWAPGRLDLFLRTLNGKLGHIWSDHGGFSALEVLDLNLVGPPSVAAWGPNRLDVFAREMGTSQLVHMYWANGWAPRDFSTGKLVWEHLGGPLSSAPGVASWGANRLDIFMGGKNGVLQHQWWDTNTWGSVWDNLGGNVAGRPSAVSQAYGRIDAFVPQEDGSMSHVRWN